MCLDDQILNTYLDNELAEPWKSQVEEHLSYCSACKERFEQLKALKQTLQSAALSDEEIAPRQENVLRMISNTRFNTKRASFLRRQFKISIPAFATIAAAFVFVFVGAILHINNGSGNDFIPAAMDSAVDETNVSLVSDAGSAKTIYEYSPSLEEVLDYLDSLGYTVSVTKKGVEPFTFD